MEVIQKIMKDINGCIIKKTIPDWDGIHLKIVSTQMDTDLAVKVLRIPRNLTKYNQALLGVKEEQKSRNKIIKYKKSLVNEDPDEVVIKDFNQFKNYIYDIVKTPHHSTNKGKKNDKKIYIGYIENLYGKDVRASHEELFSEGKVFLLEALKKYGKRPEKSKKFKTRKRKNTKGISGKSTFTFGHIQRRYINVGRSTLTGKRAGDGVDNKVVEVEFNIDCHQGKMTKDLPDMSFEKAKMEPQHWKNVMKEFGVDKSVKSVKISAGRVIVK